VRSPGHRREARPIPNLGTHRHRQKTNSVSSRRTPHSDYRIQSSSKDSPRSVGGRCTCWPRTSTWVHCSQTMRHIACIPLICIPEWARRSIDHCSRLGLRHSNTRLNNSGRSHKGYCPSTTGPTCALAYRWCAGAVVGRGVAAAGTTGCAGGANAICRGA